MRILFAGTPEVAVPSLRTLFSEGHDIAAVLTRPDAPQGRRRVMAESATAAAAKELGLNVIKASRFDDELIGAIADLDLDCGVIVAYGAFVPARLLDVPAHGWVNLHFSLLPSWRGAAPVQHSIMAGDQRVGATTFRLEAGMDTGPIYDAYSTELGDRETSSGLLTRLAEAGGPLLSETLDALASGTAVPRPQTGIPTLAPKIRHDDARVDFAQTAANIDYLVRAVTAEPGAWATLGGAVVKIGPVFARDMPAATEPGQVYLRGKSVLVGAGAHAVELTTVQPQGKKVMPARDWLRGVAAQAKSAGDEVATVEGVRFDAE